MATKYALPLMVLFVQDDDAWVALACEISVVSQGDSLDDARRMIEDAVGLWVSYEIEEGRGDRLSRPAEPGYLAEYFSGEGVITEYYTLLLSVETEPQVKVTSLEFLPSSVAPFCCHHRVAA